MPIDVDLTSFATFPKMTLHAGLASSLPGAPAYMPLLQQDHLPGGQMVAAQHLRDDEQCAERVRQAKADISPLRRRWTGGKASWRDRKKAGLKIQVQK